MKKSIIVILFVSFAIILPFLFVGYFPTHDGEWAVVRLADMVRILKDGQFPARFSGYLNHGYGYPLFNFTYPLPYYLGAVLKFLHFGYVDSIKVIFALTVPASGLFMFLASRKLWKSDLAGLISSLLYILLPYRIVDLYARGSIGESVAFAIFPILIWLMLKRSMFVSVIFATLILTHNIMAVLFLPVILLFALTQKSIKTFVYLFLGFGLSAFFWLPALVEKQNIALSITPIADRSLYFLKFQDLVLPKWGYGLPTETNGFGYQIGWPHFLIFIFASMAVVFLKNKKLAAALVFLILGLTSLMFPFTSIIWQSVPFLKEINYPWTLLAPIGFLLTLLSGILAEKKVFGFISIILVFFAAIFVLPNARPEKYINKGDGYYVSNDATTTSSDELMPVWVKSKPTERFDKKIEIVEGKGQIDGMLFDSKVVNFKAILASDSKITVNTVYYPGWQFIDNGVKIPISYKNFRGLISLDLSKGEHSIVGKISDTPLRFWSNVISVISLLGLLLYGIYKKKS